MSTNDYTSRLQAVDSSLYPLSQSPPPSPLTSPDAPPPPPASFSRIRTSATYRRRPSHLLSTPPSLIENVLLTGKKLARQLIGLWTTASLKHRIIFVALHIFFAVLAILSIIYSSRIFGALAPIGAKWRATPGGWIPIFLVTVLTAFPPIIGYSSCVTITGFVYGMRGWFIVAAATVIGSLASFIASRTVLASYVHRLVGEDKRFTAFALTLKHDGIKILVMIRLCPLPYSLSTAALSTFPTVSPLALVAATAASTPKLLIHVFIGSRMAAIAEAGGKMDLSTRVLNYASMFAFGCLGLAMGYIIYQRTVERARQIEEEEAEGLIGPDGQDREGYFEDGEVAGLAQGSAEGFGDDDISLWDNDAAGYRDDWTDDEVENGATQAGKGVALAYEDAAIEGIGGSRRNE